MFDVVYPPPTPPPPKRETLFQALAPYYFCWILIWQITLRNGLSKPFRLVSYRSRPSHWKLPGCAGSNGWRGTVLRETQFARRTEANWTICVIKMVSMPQREGGNMHFVCPMNCFDCQSLQFDSYLTFSLYSCNSMCKCDVPKYLIFASLVFLTNWNLAMIRIRIVINP